MPSFNLTANKMAMMDFQHPTTNYPLASLSATESMFVKSFAVGFEQPTGANLYRNITALKVHAYYTPEVDKTHKSVYKIINKSWEEDEATYNNQPSTFTGIWINGGVLHGGTAMQDVATIYDVNDITSHFERDVLSVLLGIVIDNYNEYTSKNTRFYTGNGTNAPYVEVVYSGNVKLSIDAVSPSSGYIPKTKDNVFSWNATPTGNSIGTLTLANTKLYWRNGTSGAYTEVDCGTATSYTLPTNSITNDIFQWYVVITDNNGGTSQSSVYTLSTVEELSTARAIAPVSTIESGANSILFKWEHIISTGTAQTKADLQKASDGTTWTSLATVTGSNTFIQRPASTFTAGQWYWRVRTYNTDNAAGDWSEPASFIYVAPPNAPTASSEQNPKPKITWQSTDQQGYQVRIQGVFDSGTVYGASNEFQIPMYLDDGNYTVEVRVINVYGLWSEYGRAPINVTHTEGSEISLTVFESNVVNLQWTATGYDSFIIYRDGEEIDETNGNSFADNFSVGKHEYYVRGIYNDSADYGTSDTVTATVEVKTLTISDVYDVRWIELIHSTSSLRENVINRNVVATDMHLTGSRFPSLFISDHEEKNLTFNVAFTNDDDSRDLFELLFGKIVCVKTPRNEMVIGLLKSFRKVLNPFYIGYECTISQIEWRE